MKIKIKLFLVGGLGCIAPNIVKYASSTLSGGTLPGNMVATSLSAMVFFLLAGFLVAFIMDAKNIKDAFYKGVAIPTLIISLANGVTSSDTTAVPVLPTTPSGVQGGIIPPKAAGTEVLPLSLVAAAYAQERSMDPACMGTIRFEVSPATTEMITVTLRSQDGTILAQARSKVPGFTIRYAEGSYLAQIDTASLQAQKEVTVRRNETTVVKVALEKKGFLKDLSQGVKNLMKR